MPSALWLPVAGVCVGFYHHEGTKGSEVDPGTVVPITFEFSGNEEASGHVRTLRAFVVMSDAESPK